VVGGWDYDAGRQVADRDDGLEIPLAVDVVVSSFAQLS
jgi:hypothetical protein